MVVEMFLVYLARLRNQRVMRLYGLKALTVHHHTASFVGHRHCISEDIILMVEGLDSTCSRVNPPLIFISEAHGMSY